jgi:hypothetical protein
VLTQPGRTGVVVPGVGQHEAADHLGGEQRLVLGQGLDVVLDDLARIVQDVADGLPGELGGKGDVNMSGPPGSRLVHCHTARHTVLSRGL